MPTSSCASPPSPSLRPRRPAEDASSPPRWSSARSPSPSPPCTAWHNSQCHYRAVRQYDMPQQPVSLPGRTSSRQHNVTTPGVRYSLVYTELLIRIFHLVNTELSSIVCTLSYSLGDHFVGSELCVTRLAANLLQFQCLLPETIAGHNVRKTETARICLFNSFLTFAAFNTGVTHSTHSVCQSPYYVTHSMHFLCHSQYSLYLLLEVISLEKELTCFLCWVIILTLQFWNT